MIIHSFCKTQSFLDNLVEGISLKFLMFTKIPFDVELLHGKFEINQNVNYEWPINTNCIILKIIIG